MPFDFDGRGAGDLRGSALKKAMRRASTLLSALILTLSAVGCKPPEPSVPDSSLSASLPRDESAEFRPSESDSPSGLPGETGETAESVITAVTVETTETAVTDAPAQTAEQSSSEQSSSEQTFDQDPETEASPQTEQVSGASGEAPSVTTAPPPVTASTAVVTSTAAKPDEPPAPVVIPDIKLPTSPKTLTILSDSAVIDYSNADQGYISASYSGSAPRAKLQLIFGESTYNFDLSVGGVTEYFPLPRTSGSCLARVCENIADNKYALAAEGTFEVNVTDETAAYLLPNVYVDYSRDSASVKKAAEVCAGLDTTIERLAAIFGWITENISYDYDLASTVKSGYIPDPDSVLDKKSGICFDYASLMAAMARSQGIPTRVVVGYASPDIYHAWNEVYTEETGWITPALFLKKHGYNIVDPTFYAGSDDKEKISEYISDAGNYSSLFYY